MCGWVYITGSVTLLAPPQTTLIIQHALIYNHPPTHLQPPQLGLQRADLPLQLAVHPAPLQRLHRRPLLRRLGAEVLQHLFVCLWVGGVDGLVVGVRGGWDAKA